MIKKHYLLKVIGYSSIPKIITVVFTLVSFPLMIRSLGTENYGVFVYFLSVIAVFESFIDFGISSASGRAIAREREKKVKILEYLKKWLLFQIKVSSIGVIPFFLIVYYISKDFQSNTDITVLFIMILTSWLTIFINFGRSSLTSLLNFKYLAFLDTFESILRSLSWLYVAFFHSTLFGLVSALLITCILTLIFCSILLIFIIKNQTKPNNHIEIKTNNKKMLNESLEFLWLRFITRAFQSIPIIIFGKLFDVKSVGTIGAFNKIIEITNLPFSVIGNGIAVRAQSVLDNGLRHVNKIWDVAFRVLSVSFFITLILFFGVDLLAHLLIPNDLENTNIFSVMVFSIFVYSISSIIAPMSDYIGSLKKRNILMSVFVIIQPVMIFIGFYIFNEIGGIIGYVLAIYLMNFGYILIAIKAFYKQEKYNLKDELKLFLLLSIIIFILFLIIDFYLSNIHFISNIIIHDIFIMSIFGVTLLIVLSLIKKIRKFYFSKEFLEF